jgi:hypothetical protein
MLAARIAACVLSRPREHFRLGSPTKSKIPGLVVFKIANGKLSEEVVVVFLSELVVPRGVVRLGVVFILA